MERRFTKVTRGRGEGLEESAIRPLEQNIMTMSGKGPLRLEELGD